MSDRLTRPRVGVGSAIVQFVLVVLLLAAVGALAGVVWYWVWSAPSGVVVDHQWVARDEEGLRGQFSGTGWFVVVATVAGLVAGVVAALAFARVPLVTLAAVVAGSVLATWVMLRVGSALGPSDPGPIAARAADGKQLPGALGVSRNSPWIALPVGALIGLALVFVGLSGRSFRRTGAGPDR